MFFGLLVSVLTVVLLGVACASSACWLLSIEHQPLLQCCCSVSLVDGFSSASWQKPAGWLVCRPYLPREGIIISALVINPSDACSSILFTAHQLFTIYCGTRMLLATVISCICWVVRIAAGCQLSGVAAAVPLTLLPSGNCWRSMMLSVAGRLAAVGKKLWTQAQAGLSQACSSCWQDWCTA
jgi:hypothetical protein